MCSAEVQTRIGKSDDDDDDGTSADVVRDNVQFSFSTYLAVTYWFITLRMNWIFDFKQTDRYPREFPRRLDLVAFSGDGTASFR